MTADQAETLVDGQHLVRLSSSDGAGLSGRRAAWEAYAIISGFAKEEARAGRDGSA